MLLSSLFVMFKLFYKEGKSTTFQNKNVTVGLNIDVVEKFCGCVVVIL